MCASSLRRHATLAARARRRGRLDRGPSGREGHRPGTGRGPRSSTGDQHAIEISFGSPRALTCAGVSGGRCCVVERGATESRAHPTFTFICCPYSEGSLPRPREPLQRCRAYCWPVSAGTASAAQTLLSRKLLGSRTRCLTGLSRHFR